MDGTIIGQGSFTAQFSGANPNPGSASDQAAMLKIIEIPSGADWVKVYNYTKAGADGQVDVYFQGTANASAGVEFYWQRGMAPGTGIVRYKGDGVATLSEDTMVSGGFTLYDPIANAVGTINATITAISNAAIPVVSNSGTNGLLPGDIVRLTNVINAQQLGGLDFTVGYNTLTAGTFSLDYMSQLALAGTTGSWRKINFEPIFYPRHRFISKITQALQAVVTLTVAHGFTVGQEVRVVVPDVYGMVEIDGLSATIVAIDTTPATGNTITLDIDSTTFTAFAFPVNADVPFSPAMIVPIGEAATAPWQNLLDDATINTAFLGMILGAGGNGNALTTPLSGPAGTVHFSAADAIDARDTMFWVAGKSTYGGL